MKKEKAGKILKKYPIDKKGIERLSRIRYINQSIIILKNLGLFYEAILFSSQVVEFTVKELIERCEKIIKENVEKKTVLKYKRKINLEKKTLGSLIILLKEFISNASLINDLEEFLDIRNEIAHKLITTNKKIKDIEINSKKYVEDDKIFNLLKKILKESGKIGLSQWKINLEEKGEKMPQFLESRLEEYKS